MRKPVLTIAFLSCLLIGMNDPIIAQETDTVVMDEVVVDDETEEEESSGYFNPVTEEDRTLVKERQVSKSALENLRKDTDFWYVEKERKKPKAKEQPSFFLWLFGQRWFGIAMWTIVIAGFVGVIVWFLLASDVRLFRKKPVPIANQEDDIDEDIFEINYEMAISKAIAVGDYRLAVRLMYLQLLKELSQRTLIQYKQGRTNSEYMSQLFGTVHYPLFSRLTRQFEYVWYGKFPVSPAAFEAAQKDHANLKSRFS